MTDRMIDWLILILIVLVVSYAGYRDYTDNHHYCIVDDNGVHWTESEENGREPIKCTGD